MKSEKIIEQNFIEKLKQLKYIYREDIKDRLSLEENFRIHFQKLNRINLSDSEFARLKESIITTNVFSAAKILRETNTFKRDDDTPLQYTLVNTNDWCKNKYEVINQFRINTENSHHRYDVIILINGIPVIQVELKSLQITPKEQWNRLLIIKMTPGMDIQILCFASYSFLLSAMKLIPIILLITTKNILLLMPMKDFCPYINLPIKIIKNYPFARFF
ncbi:type I restriction endonuclease [Campylobacter helveticus]|uniref:type I restriction endonuclease n=1 Tax=Campylobacter helveticus TaxID=28898 RepID=UPI001F0DEF54|nr:type I restriction endonuclease [Campylobacter helveticus]